MQEDEVFMGMIRILSVTDEVGNVGMANETQSLLRRAVSFHGHQPSWLAEKQE